jgi:predicted transcriptional regulator
MTPEALKEARRNLGLTVPQLAVMLGVHQDHIRRMEMQPGKPTHRPVRGTTERLIAAYLSGYRPDDWPHPRSRKGQP